jgi:hypothetical protein
MDAKTAVDTIFVGRDRAYVNPGEKLVSGIGWII